MESQRGVKIHVYNTTAYAYDETQTNAEIRSGDVVIAESEGVVGILDEAWPFAITEAHGEFHGPPEKSAHLIRDGRYSVESLTVALAEAYERGFPVSHLNSPRSDILINEDLRPPDAYCWSCEDSSGEYPVYDNSTDAVVGWRKCPVTRNHPPRPPERKRVSLVRNHKRGCDGVTTINYECCPPF